MLLLLLLIPLSFVKTVIYILKKEANEREISLKVYSSYWISELFYEEKLWEKFFNVLYKNILYFKYNL